MIKTFACWSHLKVLRVLSREQLDGNAHIDSYVTCTSSKTCYFHHVSTAGRQVILPLINCPLKSTRGDKAFQNVASNQPINFRSPIQAGQTMETARFGTSRLPMSSRSTITCTVSTKEISVPNHHANTHICATNATKAILGFNATVHPIRSFYLKYGHPLPTSIVCNLNILTPSTLLNSHPNRYLVNYVLEVHVSALSQKISYLLLKTKYN